MESKILINASQDYTFKISIIHIYCVGVPIFSEVFLNTFS